MKQTKHEFAGRTVTLTLVEDDQSIDLFRRWLHDHPDIAMDTETTGLQWWRPDFCVTTVQFGHADAGWTVPLDFAGAGPLIREALEWANSVVFHNAKFDLHALRTAGYGWPCGTIHDSMFAAHAADERYSWGLKQTASRLVDSAAGDLSDRLAPGAKGKDWASLTAQDVWEYGAFDPVLTWHVWQALAEWHTSDIYQLEQAILPIFPVAEAAGLCVDTAFARLQAQILGQRLEQLETLLLHFGIDVPGSNQQVADALIRNGVLLTQQTGKGAWSVSAEVLTAIDHPIAEWVLEYRKARKLKSAFFDSLVDYAGPDGRIHPNLSQVGTRTGRMACSEPNMQQIPQAARGCIVPSEGRKLVAIDYSQIELRMLAHFAERGSGQLTTAFREGRDLHSYAAELIFGADFQPHHRALCKTVVFAMIYGSGINGMAVSAGVSFRQMQEFLERYSQEFPEARRYMFMIQRAVEQRHAQEGVGYVRSPYGRMHRAAPDLDRVYQLGNYLLQGTAADLLKDRMRALDTAGLMAHFRMAVHDELIWDVPEGEAQEFAVAARTIMEDVQRFSVPIVTGEPKIMDRWGA